MRDGIDKRFSFAVRQNQYRALAQRFLRRSLRALQHEICHAALFQFSGPLDQRSSDGRSGGRQNDTSAFERLRSPDEFLQRACFFFLFTIVR
jgi:hypothetical protein